MREQTFRELPDDLVKQVEAHEERECCQEIFKAMLRILNHYYWEETNRFIGDTIDYIEGDVLDYLRERRPRR